MFYSVHSEWGTFLEVAFAIDASISYIYIYIHISILKRFFIFTQKDPMEATTQEGLADGLAGTLLKAKMYIIN